MTKEESNLFCRIAIRNKLVSLEEANACLREALTAKRNVSEILVVKGLLTKNQAVKIRQAVLRHMSAAAGQAGAPAAAPAKHKGARLHEGRKKHPAEKMNSTQLALVMGSLVVVVVVLSILVYLLMRTPPRPAEPSKTPVAASAPGTPGSSAALAPAAPIAPPKPATPPALSAEEQHAIEGEFNKAILDANQGAAEKVGSGLASLDAFMKDYGAQATEDQKAQIKTKREQLLNIIKDKFTKDKERLLAAKAKGDQGEVENIRKDIEYYADPDTMKEVDQIIAGAK